MSSLHSDKHVQHTVFINPISNDLESLSPTLNDIKLKPELFADDGLLIHLNTRDRAHLIRGCLAWAAKWQLPVSLPKCALFSIFDPTSDTVVEGHKFKDVDGTTHLGLGIDKKGVFSFAKIQQDLTRITNKHARFWNA